MWINFDGKSLRATLLVNRDDARRSAEEWGLETATLDRAHKASMRALEELEERRASQDAVSLADWHAGERQTVARFNVADAAAVDHCNKALDSRLLSPKQKSAALRELEDSRAAMAKDYDHQIAELNTELEHARRENAADYTARVQQQSTQTARIISEIYHAACVRCIINETANRYETSTDYACLIDREAPRIQRASNTLFLTLSRTYRELESVQDATLSMVATALSYQVPSDEVNGRFTWGLRPPAACLAGGWGDCDSKAVLLASLMNGWKSSGGTKTSCLCVEMPGHCLLAVQRIPITGQTYVEFKGEPYILMEAVGPGALPSGQISDSTREYISAGGQFTLFKVY
jgi:hypothetical protein